MALKQKKSAKSHLAEVMAIFLIVFSAVILAFSSGGFAVSFKTVGFSIVSTAQKAVGATNRAVISFFSAVKQLADLKKENENLRNQIKDFEFFKRENTELRRENERLKAQLDFAENLEQKNFPAQVIGRESDNLYSGLVINKGSRHGIKKNMPVLAIQEGNIGLVGKIVTVGFFTSVVMPVYDSKCAVSCRIQRTRDLGLAIGLDSPSLPLELRYIRKRVVDELYYGDFVVTSGENNNYAPNIPVGTISKFLEVQYDSSLYIEITPAVDFSRLENVIVTDLKQINDQKPSVEGK